MTNGNRRVKRLQRKKRANSKVRQIGLPKVGRELRILRISFPTIEQAWGGAHESGHATKYLMLDLGWYQGGCSKRSWLPQDVPGPNSRGYMASEDPTTIL